MFHKFLLRERNRCGQSDDPGGGAEESAIALPHTLSPGEVERLLAAPQGDDPLDLRDRAMLEILYATGLRVSELVGLKLGDLQLDVGYLTAFGKRSKQRIVPLGESAMAELRRYLQLGRPLLDKEGSRASLSQPLREGVDTPGLLEDY